MKSIYIGLMSGTSLDGADIAIVDFTDNQCKLMQVYTFPMPLALKQRILSLCQGQKTTLRDYGKTDILLGDFFAESIVNSLQKSGLKAQDIEAIGHHGQTVWHDPEEGFTLQIGNAHTIAQKTHIDVIADFRQADMVRGGQGAPLAPAFHHYLFAHRQKKRAIVNLGGIANISLLIDGQPILGWDTGPANILMDAWILDQKNTPYDKDGAWAASGHIHEGLLKAFLSEKWFALPYPKSTGREVFNLTWLKKKLSLFDEKIKAADVQASLLALTAQSLSNQMAAFDFDEVIFCGGGVKNRQLIAYFATLNPKLQLFSAADLGVDSDYLEAAMLAWYAKEFRQGRKASLPSVTGANSSCILGVLYPSKTNEK